MNIEIIKYLISVNKDLVENTALKNCHCIGLNSFIINEKPRIRLFVADNNCELYKKYDYTNPTIPIHPHKYDDIFHTIHGRLKHHAYIKYEGLELGKPCEFNSYSYNRICDDKEIQLIGKTKLQYVGAMDMEVLKSKVLHSVSLESGYNKASWIITETYEDKEFKQIAYHKDLVKRNELYKHFKNPIKYLNEYFEI